MVWCRNSKIRWTFKNICATYYGIHCLQLIPSTRDYGVKLYQIRGKYTDKRLLSTQKSNLQRYLLVKNIHSSKSIWVKIERMVGFAEVSTQVAVKVLSRFNRWLWILWWPTSANYSSKWIRMSNAMAFVLVVGIVRAIRLSCASRVVVAAISIPYF